MSATKKRTERSNDERHSRPKDKQDDVQHLVTFCTMFKERTCEGKFSL